MSTSSMEKTIGKLSTPGFGILAADESTNTIKKRFDSIDAESTEESRRHYRDMLFTTRTLGDFIGGAILFEETLKQHSHSGKTIPEALLEQGILPGIKVDKGLINLQNTHNEKTTQGLDGLPDRLADFKKHHAVFAKWRAVYNISDSLPSTLAMQTNAELLARYAAMCQEQDIVPIVEPEVLMDGNHSIERCAEVTEAVQAYVFNALRRHNVILELMILKPNMILPGQDSGQKVTPEQVADLTLRVLRRTTPAAVPTINFLSGGQSDLDSTINLQAINAASGAKPWHLSYSYGRALQAPSLKVWQGKKENDDAAQAALLKRANLNTAATKGEYQENME